jgi:hypothetical protein
VLTTGHLTFPLPRKDGAIIHTIPAIVEPMKALTADLLPGSELVNFVDDSILPQLGENGGNLAEVEERLIHYARFAEQVGADVILEKDVMRRTYR